MRLGESLEWEQIEVAHVFVREQVGEEVVAFVIPGASWWLCVSAGDHFEFRIWRIAGEILVGINVFLCWMINRDQLDRVEIDDFLHGFHETEAQHRGVPHRCLSVR